MEVWSVDSVKSREAKVCVYTECTRRVSPIYNVLAPSCHSQHQPVFLPQAATLNISQSSSPKLPLSASTSLLALSISASGRPSPSPETNATYLSPDDAGGGGRGTCDG